MPSLYCEQCGGELSVNQQEDSKICPYCGAKNRVPASITRTERMYQMAVRYRMRKNFDAAKEYYENILEQDSEELEACWGMLLCKYGVEYVSSTSGEREIRCHRICESAVTADIYYKMISTYADSGQMEYYAAEAAKIQTAQQELLAFVKREARYDVYLCYKEQGIAEGDATDKETIQELVSFLEKEGIRVFYSRERVEKEHPEQLDQYLLAAQYAAPVMIVYGSKKSFFSHESVRNEWSSYRTLMMEKKGKKMYVACGETIMYSLPKELLDLPKLNMDSIEFYAQVRKEIFGDAKQKNAAAANSEAENLYVRAQIAMEDGAFDEANGYYDRIIEKHPEEGRAYWGRLLCECKCQNGEQLRSRGLRINEMPSYKFAIRYAAQTDKEYYEDIAGSILSEIRTKQKAEEDERLRKQQQEQEEQQAREKRRLEREIEEQKCAKKKAAFWKKAVGALVVVGVIGAAGGVLWYQQSGKHMLQQKKIVSLIQEGELFAAEAIIEEQYVLGYMSEEYRTELYIEWAKAQIEDDQPQNAVSKLMELRGDGTNEEIESILAGLQAKAEQLWAEGDMSNAYYYYDMMREYAPENIEFMRDYIRPYRDWLSVYNQHAVIKKADGTAVVYGWDMDTSLVSGWSDLAGVFTSANTVFGWTNAGTVYAAGDYTSDTFADWKDIVQVVGNESNVIGLTGSGTVLSLQSGTTEPVSGLEDIRRLAMGTDGSFALHGADGTVYHYNNMMNIVQGEYRDVIDTAFAGSSLQLLYDNSRLSGSVRIMQNSDPEFLLIYPGMSFTSYIKGDGSAAGSFCGANHMWFFFDGPRALVTGNGYTGYYDEARECYEEAIYYITFDGTVYIRHSIHGYDKLGITTVDISDDVILNIYE